MSETSKDPETTQPQQYSAEYFAQMLGPQPAGALDGVLPAQKADQLTHDPEAVSGSELVKNGERRGVIVLDPRDVGAQALRQAGLARDTFRL